MSGFSILTLPKSERLSAQAGMRPSLEGTQASGEGESHAQDANVAVLYRTLLLSYSDINI
jgi:hypothetical protein